MVISVIKLLFVQNKEMSIVCHGCHPEGRERSSDQNDRIVSGFDLSIEWFGLELLARTQITQTKML